MPLYSYELFVDRRTKELNIANGYDKCRHNSTYENVKTTFYINSNEKEFFPFSFKIIYYNVGNNFVVRLDK